MIATQNHLASSAPVATPHHVDFTDLRQFTGKDGRIFHRREHQIMAMVAYGFGDKVIADYLDSNVKAVQMIIYKILWRNNWTRSQLARYYRSQIGLD